ncbi:hypothetical protein [Nostoc cycadae]|uniref:Uncharacterized protein n=1 Tax=Nostoc cycadae WK-1 TaxID=1861711 RepID=A0A2H6LJB3_9NOSO|nr:hypothetical protein [Nostoc cycadae]GBE93311.1 hypothetical protein NCWK1_3073 [Nostoc cycadae WK-1]
MTRQKPLNNGKPRKTEPGAIQSIGKIDRINQQKSNKLDKAE